MAGTANTPPAAPAAPATPPPAAPQAPPPGSPPSYLNPENDPNLAMSRLVAKSREKLDKVMSKGADTPAEPPQTPPATPPAAPATPPPAAPAAPGGEAPKLTKLFGKALKFTERPAPGAPAAPQTPPADPPAPAAPAPGAAAPPAAPPAEPPAAPETKGKRGKKVAPVVDHVQLAREAATAATTAALATLKPQQQQPDPTAELSNEDKADYDIAVHLAKIDPRYKDAPKLILEHVRQAEEYATNWQRANPGKLFDSKDEEHNEFYAKLVRPWSPQEFNNAAIKLGVSQELAALDEKRRQDHNAELDTVKEGQGRVELAPVVEQHFGTAAMALAQQVDASVHAALSTKGWDGLADVDPLTAEVMTVTLQQLHPFIETVVQLDDPHRRFKLDMRKPAHQQWNQVVMQGEANLVGTQLDDGRMFAKRADYAKMNQEQQMQHWFLTTEMIIQGAVDYAASQVKQVTEQQRQRLEKMGYVRTAPKNTPGNAPAGGAPATHQPAAPAAVPAAPVPDKPASPTVGSGAKIDQPGGNPLSAEGKIINFFSKARGN